MQIVNLAGRQALLFDAAPNWRQNVSRRLEYQTTVFSSVAQVEQRRALRARPRKELTFSILQEDARFREVQAAIAGWQNRLYLVPDHVRFVRTAEAMAADAVRAILVEEAPWLKSGMYVLLSHRDRSAPHRVSEVIGREVLFDTTESSSWPAGTLMVPFYPAMLMDGARTQLYTSSVSAVPLTFAFEPGADLFEPRGQPVATYYGMEILLKRHNWAGPVDLDVQSEFQVFDPGFGLRSVDEFAGFATRTERRNYLCRDREEAEYTESFFRRAKGRRGTFYAPTWTRDFVPSVDMPAGSFFLVAHQEYLFHILKDNPTYRSIVLFLRDGRILTNRIEEWIRVEGGYGIQYGLSYGLNRTLLNEETDVLFLLRDPWPEDISASDVLFGSWLFAWRLASDIMESVYETREVSRVTFTLQQLIDHDPDERMDSGYGLAYGRFYGGSAAA